MRLIFYHKGKYLTVQLISILFKNSKLVKQISFHNFFYRFLTVHILNLFFLIGSILSINTSN